MQPENFYTLWRVSPEQQTIGHYRVEAGIVNHLCVCVCVYMCVLAYMCMSVCTYVCMYVHMHVCMCVYVFMHVCVCVCMCVFWYVVFLGRTAFKEAHKMDFEPKTTSLIMLSWINFSKYTFFLKTIYLGTHKHTTIFWCARSSQQA